ncbi:MAG: diguanylate cyclase [Rhizobacter sp.]
MLDTLDVHETRRTRAAVHGMAMLNLQAEVLRAHFRQLRTRLVELQLALSKDEADQQLALAASRADAIAEAARVKFDDLARQAKRDPLTGLPTSDLMRERILATIARAGRRELRFAMLVIDIDHFHEVNDVFGRAGGDEVLRETGRRLERAVRDTDGVSRLGADQFLVLLADLSALADPRVVATKLQDRLHEPMMVGGGVVQVRASIGVSHYPTDAHDAQTLFALADAAVHAAKREGGHRCFGQREMGTAEPPGASLEHAALDRISPRHGSESGPTIPPPAGARSAPVGMGDDHLDFLAMVAHELRNPLAPLRQAAALLTRGGMEEEGLTKLQAIIVRQVSRMARLIDDLLHISREGTGRFRLNEQDVDLGQLFLTVTEACHPSIRSRRQVLVTHFPERWPTLRGDAVRLAQVFGNLIDNASRYTPEEGQVELTATVSATEIEVVVSDTGFGISAAALEHIFKLFVQENRVPSASDDGLGIGLAVVRDLVHLHGGTVTARSDGPNMGSTFAVKLPLGGTSASKV